MIHSGRGFHPELQNHKVCRFIDEITGREEKLDSWGLFEIMVSIED
jgi:hypothetical protein